MVLAARHLLLRLLALPAAFALGACALPDFESFRAPSADAIFRPLSVTNVKDRVLPPVAPDDLVDASGRCAGAYAPPVESAGDQPGSQAPAQQVSIIPSAVALDMSECDVVKRAGFPERVEIGATERNERTATLTYAGGPRPGVYSFVEGRLKSMERGPEPSPAPKTAKKPAKPAAKPRQAAAQ